MWLGGFGWISGWVSGWLGGCVIGYLELVG